eukprot:8058251-Alexandrium_andersonii.AAC.1
MFPVLTLDSDIIPDLTAAHDRVSEFFRWSFACLESGLWPTVGFDGECFAPDTTRGKMAGEPLLGGWTAT